MDLHPRFTDAGSRRPTLVVTGPGTAPVASELIGVIDADVISGRGPSDAVLVIVGHATPVGLDQIRALYPTAIIMAVLARDTVESDIVDLYRHGADLVTGPSPAALLVAHVHALLRRRAWAEIGGEGTKDFPSVDPAATDG